MTSKSWAGRQGESGGAEFAVGDGRTHLNTNLMGASLVRTDLADQTDVAVEVAMLPNCAVVAVGGRSIMDRGAKAVLPLVDAGISWQAHLFGWLGGLLTARVLGRELGRKRR